MTTFLKSLKGDKVIWMVVIILSLFSILAVYSSTGTLAYKYQGGNTMYYLLKHLILLFGGFLLMYLTHLVKHTYFSRIFQIALYITIPLLILTLIVGLDLNDAKRALPLPFGLSFETSDLAKLALIVYMARSLTRKQEIIKDFKSAFLPIILPVLVVCGLILPANLSTSVMLFGTCLVLMFIGRIRFKYIMLMVGIMAVFMTIFILILINMPGEQQGRFSTWQNRVENFIDPDEGENYQIEQSKIAIASGGFFGKMPGNSTQRNFLPHPYSDFIFAIIMEEYGLIGGLFLILLYMILLFRAVKIVTKIPSNFGAFVTIGIAFNLVFQALINMGVAVNLLPVTGQPLPMVSMGGTSIWFTSISLGIILSISREIQQPTNTEEEQEENYVPAA
jgi:cell division protein FtsW